MKKMRKVLAVCLCLTLFASFGAMPAYAAVPVVSGFSASPSSSGVATLSPGGTDRLQFTYRYLLDTANTVTVSVKTGTAWKTILTRTESVQGAKTFLWDGKVAGVCLPSGNYTVRITCLGLSSALTVKLIPKPVRSIASVSPSVFFNNGSNTQKISIKWTRLCDVRLDVLSKSGKQLRCVYSARNKPAGSAVLSWNGRDDKGKLLPAGTYRLRLICGGAASLFNTVTIKAPSSGMSAVEKQMVDLVNQSRKAAGLAPLVFSSSLRAGALKHSQDMSAHSFLSHTSPRYGTMPQRMKSAGISYLYAGENCALSSSITRAFQMLMDSSGHRANILSSHYTHIGIGIVWNATKKQYYMTQWFAKFN